MSSFTFTLGIIITFLFFSIDGIIVSRLLVYTNKQTKPILLLAIKSRLNPLSLPRLATQNYREQTNKNTVTAAIVTRILAITSPFPLAHFDRGTTRHKQSSISHVFPYLSQTIFYLRSVRIGKTSGEQILQWLHGGNKNVPIKMLKKLVMA